MADGATAPHPRAPSFAVQGVPASGYWWIVHVVGLVANVVIGEGLTMRAHILYCTRVHLCRPLKLHKNGARTSPSPSLYDATMDPAAPFLLMRQGNIFARGLRCVTSRSLLYEWGVSLNELESTGHTAG
jgi:hypothetical protein